MPSLRILPIETWQNLLEPLKYTCFKTFGSPTPMRPGQHSPRDSCRATQVQASPGITSSILPPVPGIELTALACSHDDLSGRQSSKLSSAQEAASGSTLSSRTLMSPIVPVSRGMLVPKFYRRVQILVCFVLGVLCLIERPVWCHIGEDAVFPRCGKGTCLFMYVQTSCDYCLRSRAAGANYFG